MNKYERKIIILAASLMGVFFFAILYNVFGRNIDVPTCLPYNQQYAHAGVKKLDDSTYQVNVVAAMWSYDPGEIVVPEGSSVDFFLTSKDVVHGFDIEKKGVNLMAVPGAVNKTTVTFEEAGTYRIVCHEFCGAGHQNMMGKVIVKSKYSK